MLFRDLPGVTTCRFKQGEYLLRRGEPMPYVYYLKKGEVKREGVVVRTAEGWLLRDTEALHDYLDGTRKMKYD